MSIRFTQLNAYADLGDIWLRDQLARLTQKHAQFGRHYRIDADALLIRLAGTARAANAAATREVPYLAPGDCIRQAMINSSEPYSLSEEHNSHVAASAIAH